MPAPSDWPTKLSNNDQKQQAIQDFTQHLINACLISVSQAKQYLEILIARNQVKSLPTTEVFYPYQSLFNLNHQILKTKYPDLVGLTPDQNLPIAIGQYKLNPTTTMQNKRYFISQIVRKTEELGFEKIYIDTGGIYYYLKKTDLGPLASAYFEMLNEIIPCYTLTVEQVRDYLEPIMEQTNCAPTHGVFFTHVRLLAGKTGYPELTRMTTESTLPTQIGPYQLSLNPIFANEEWFISKLVRHAKENGFEGANISPFGITFYLPPDKLGPRASEIYRQFFLTKEEIEQKILEQKNERSFRHEKMIVLTFGKFYSNPQVQRINYELRKHYNTLGFSVNLSYDWRYEKEDQPLVLKIYIDPDEYKEKIKYQEELPPEDLLAEDISEKTTQAPPPPKGLNWH